MDTYIYKSQKVKLVAIANQIRNGYNVRRIICDQLPAIFHIAAASIKTLREADHAVEEMDVQTLAVKTKDLTFARYPELEAEFLTKTMRGKASSVTSTSSLCSRFVNLNR